MSFLINSTLECKCLGVVGLPFPSDVCATIIEYMSFSAYCLSRGPLGLELAMCSMRTIRRFSLWIKTRPYSLSTFSECFNIFLSSTRFAHRFCSSFRMEAVFAWCKGAKFIEVQTLTNTFEGTTIRTLRRLEELVRQIANASAAIGNQELQSKFEKGSELLKRDIVFCSSLYL